MKQAASEFLANRRIAVTGVSRSPQDHGANIVYRRLRERGYEVFAINPRAAQVEVIDAIRPDISSGESTGRRGGAPDRRGNVRECVDLGINTCGCTAGGAGSVSDDRRIRARARIAVIERCPCMFDPCRSDTKSCAGC
jgi:hypothetical protein